MCIPIIVWKIQAAGVKMLAFGRSIAYNLSSETHPIVPAFECTFFK